MTIALAPESLLSNRVFYIKNNMFNRQNPTNVKNSFLFKNKRLIDSVLS